MSSAIIRPALSNHKHLHAIWLIGGTSESAKIAEAIASQSLPCLITVTTASAQSLYPASAYLTLQVGQLNQQQIGQFCRQEKIRAIVDASHPYAVEISQNAIAISQEENIPYLRYERPRVPSDSGAQEIESFDALLAGEYLLGQRVFLTVGYRALSLFKSWQNRATLFARILPVVNSLEVALALGFTPDRLLALRPPFSAAFEKALWQQWRISLVITKASGEAGGEAIKRAVAAELGIPLLVIARPQIAYPQQTQDILEVLNFCHQHLSKT